ncbi:hypothetical protein [Enterobacter huaxiensis]|uniref:hypothetical protein n=1 Tax=Enterobacter huaxiensis TaxID=2494702 RepID=UPI0021DA56A1|nr:hypothetical protein [Enterobacter huaxiensis]
MINNIPSHAVHPASKPASFTIISGSFNINKVFVSDVVSVKKYPSSLDRNGNTFQSFSNRVALTRLERIEVSSTHHSGTTDHGVTPAHDRTLNPVSSVMRKNTFCLKGVKCY